MAYTESCARDSSSIRVTRQLAAGETHVLEFLLTDAVTMPPPRALDLTVKIKFGRTDEHAPPGERFQKLDEYPGVLWFYTFDYFTQTEVVHLYFKNYTVETLRSARVLAHRFNKEHLLDAVSWIRRQVDESA